MFGFGSWAGSIPFPCTKETPVPFPFFPFFFKKQKKILFFTRYLVDPASNHMLVLKIKPCMSKYKQFIQRNCERLIKSVIVYLIVPLLHG